jgi:hypothetical protein
MSSAEKKGAAPVSRRAHSIRMWTDRLSPTIGAALLPELIRLIGEYCLSRLSWSPTLRSPETVIADADADGFGRVLHFPSLRAGCHAALSAEPLSELAGAAPVFTWAVRVDQWAGSSLTVGVAFEDTDCTLPEGSCGVGARASLGICSAGATGWGAGTPAVACRLCNCD